MTLEQQIERGREARRFLESAIFQEVMKGSQDAFIDRWLNQDRHDEKIALASWASIQALAEVEHNLNVLVSNGEMAAAQLKARK